MGREEESGGGKWRQLYLNSNKINNSTSIHRLPNNRKRGILFNISLISKPIKYITGIKTHSGLFVNMDKKT